MRDPIDHLLEEHRAIMTRLAPLRRAVEELHGEGADLSRILPVLQDAGQMMATTLLLHARQEDEALFPEIERALDSAGGPTAVMRQEHRDIHAGAELFRRTLRELNEVEHPAIMARGEALRSLPAGVSGTGQLRGIAEEILALVDAHFGKEEQILFPMARQVLTSEALEQTAQRMEEIVANAGLGPR